MWFFWNLFQSFFKYELHNRNWFKLASLEWVLMPVFLILTYISFHLPPPPHGVAVNLLRTAAYVWGFLIGVHGLHFPVLMVCCCCVKAWDGWRGKSSCRSLLVWVRVGTEVGGIFRWAYCSGGFVNSGIWGIHRTSLIIWGSFSKLRTVILAQGK